MPICTHICGKVCVCVCLGDQLEEQFHCMEITLLKSLEEHTHIPGHYLKHVLFTLKTE